MKKTITTVAVCAILGIVIYAGYYFLHDGSNEPIPDPMPVETADNLLEQPENPISDPTTDPAKVWEELSAKTQPAEPPNDTEPQSPADEQYPKVVNEDDNETVIDFTDPDKGKTLPPDKVNLAEVTSGQTEQDTSKTAVTPEPSATPAPTPKANATPKPKATATPKPAVTPKPSGNGTNEKRSDGAVYDPVFGWVIPSKVISEPISSDKSVDEMVGTMGGD